MSKTGNIIDSMKNLIGGDFPEVSDLPSGNSLIKIHAYSGGANNAITPAWIIGNYASQPPIHYFYHNDPSICFAGLKISYYKNPDYRGCIYALLSDTKLESISLDYGRVELVHINWNHNNWSHGLFFITIGK